jgi:multidrug efflux pump subunit AcrB
MARFFINRPIVAMVISIVMLIIGVVAMVRLPIAQFPELAPPEILLQATYVGADALTLEQSVATPIEQQLQGVDNMIYMSSINSSSGLMRLRVNFDVGTDPNSDQILTQMRYLQAESQLPSCRRPQPRCYPSQGDDQPAGAVLSLLAEGNLRRHFPRQLRVHQRQRSDEPRAWCRPGSNLRRGPVRDALLGAA